MPPLLRYFWFHSIYSLAASCSQQSAACSLRSAVCGLAVCGLWSAVGGLQSAVCGLRSAVCSLQSTVCRCHTPSISLTISVLVVGVTWGKNTVVYNRGFDFQYVYACQIFFESVLHMENLPWLASKLVSNRTVIVPYILD